MMKYLTKILDTLEPLLKLRGPDRSNTGKLLWDIYLWQSVLAHAKKQHEKAWRAATANQLIPEDDELRKSLGERIVLQTEKLACVVRVDPPRAYFDKEAFIFLLVKKYKLDFEEVVSLANECNKGTTPVLTKRVAETGE